MSDKQAAKVTIDGVDYALDSLSPNAKSLINLIRTADREIRHYEAQMTLARIAQQTIANSLKAELANPKVAESVTPEVQA